MKNKNYKGTSNTKYGRYKFLGEYYEMADRASKSLGLSMSSYIKLCIHKGLERHMELQKELTYMALEDHLNRLPLSALKKVRKRNDEGVVARLRKRKKNTHFVTYPRPKPLTMPEVRGLLSTRHEENSRKRIGNFGSVTVEGAPVFRDRVYWLLREDDFWVGHGQKTLESQIIVFFHAELRKGLKIRQTLDIQRTVLREFLWEKPLIEARQSSKEVVQALRAGEKDEEIQQLCRIRDIKRAEMLEKCGLYKEIKANRKLWNNPFALQRKLREQAIDRHAISPLFDEEGFCPIFNSRRKRGRPFKGFVRVTPNT
jgi:hypothetical protein